MHVIPVVDAADITIPVGIGDGDGEIVFPPEIGELREQLTVQQELSAQLRITASALEELPSKENLSAVQTEQKVRLEEDIAELATTLEAVTQQLKTHPDELWELYDRIESYEKLCTMLDTVEQDHHALFEGLNDSDIVPDSILEKEDVLLQQLETLSSQFTQQREEVEAALVSWQKRT